MMPKYWGVGIVVLVLVGGGILYRQNRQLHTQLIVTQARISAMMQRPRSRSGGRREDPYVAGAVNNTIIKQYTAIAAIYKRYLATHPKKADGRIKVDWQITPDGKVLDPGVVFSELDPGSLMKKDLLKMVATWHFPPPPPGINRYIAHTFLFREHPMTKAERARARQSRVESMLQTLNSAKSRPGK